jgi:predicted GNAT family N-acyltransferase
MRRATKAESRRLKVIIEQAMGWTGGWEESVLYVAVCGQTIVGCVREYVTPMDEIHIIESVWVTPAARGQRLGHRLMRYLMEHSTAQQFYLDCRPPLQKYYEACGFRIISTVPPELYDSVRELVYLECKKY